ncbi:glycine/betaine ABC transporter substrate-binding protein [Pseudoalteromonas rubra]|uniref:Glycine/betaine ABC transporter substrate-binding protein n=2 Tax=Pseudoalteromonas rubra TaxID=43658 RepID=A0A0U3HU52_9GAMM|nr:glycine/betaine ABC transporter substrate-binding protein [Pseudoalteromonas rubra]
MRTEKPAEQPAQVGLIRAFIHWVLGFIICLLPGPALAMNKSSEIVIPLNNWASQRVLSHAVGDIIKRYGFAVSYRDMPARDQWGAMQKGLIHFQIEVWQQSTAGSFYRMLDNQHIVDLGMHDAMAREEWWYPEYVAALCPGLPHWKALNTCAPLFSARPGEAKGTFYTIDWDYQDADLIRALGLNFTIERLSNEAELWQKLEQASDRNQPIVLINWTPNWTDFYRPGQFVEFPAYEKACETEASWGINRNLVNDCGNPQQGWLRKAGWPGLEQTYPCIYNLLKKVNFSQNMIADASAMSIVEGHTEVQAAQLWQTKYAPEITRWLDPACLN